MTAAILSPSGTSAQLGECDALIHPKSSTCHHQGDACSVSASSAIKLSQIKKKKEPFLTL